MKVANRVIKNTGILYARMAITVFISLYTTRLTINVLGSSDFGIFNLVGGIIAMLAFLNMSMTFSTQRFMSYAEGAGEINKLKKIFNVSILMHFFVAVVVFILLEIVGNILFDHFLKIEHSRLEAAKYVFHFSVISTSLSIISVPYDAVVNAHENMLFYAILSVAEAIFKLLIAVSITYITSDKLIVYGLGMASMSVLLLFIRVVFCHIRYSECIINFKDYFDISVFREMSNFAGWSFLGSTSSVITQYGQGLVLNTFFGTVANASQGIANQVSGQLGAFASTMQKALNPVINKSEGSGDRNLMIKSALVGNRVSFYLWCLFCIPVLIKMPYLLEAWLSNVPKFAVIFCRIYITRILIEQLYVTLSSAIMAVGKIRLYQVSSSLLTILPLPICYLIFSFGYPAYFMYIVFTFYSICNLILTVYYAKVNCNLSLNVYFNDVILKCLLSFCIPFGMSILTKNMFKDELYETIAIIIVNTVTFCLTVWNLGLKREEKDYASLMTQNSWRKATSFLKSNFYSFKY